MSEQKNITLLTDPVKVVNIGLEEFTDDLSKQGVETVQVEWKPPAGGDPILADLLSKLGG